MVLRLFEPSDYFTSLPLGHELDGFPNRSKGGCYFGILVRSATQLPRADTRGGEEAAIPIQDSGRKRQSDQQRRKCNFSTDE